MTQVQKREPLLKLDYRHRRGKSQYISPLIRIRMTIPE
ncbi:hypothetical protein T4C_5331 [Trichinella pseudospiralis]|uniref:Uncharacterized protein n=1 Tax=Trichinella pseudospiralis TaxID=6337 RepID=A0A0V1HAJ0_TRIPS|nr:hypothetical protein T4C_5331 [Trichinella pseudospiralis]